MTFDSATIAAFVDGEVDDVTARRIERAALADRDLAAAIERHRALKGLLTTHYAPVLDEEVPDRLTALLAGRGAIDTSLSARREAKQARFGAVQWGAMAAALALGLTIGLRPWLPAAPVAVEQGALVASGALAQALDTQLAAAQSGDAAIRIGLSFQDKEGRYCRSFESGTVQGIGCRSADGWSLVRTLGGATASEYRQASSGRLAADAAEVMAGAPLDAAAERAARDGGWSATAPE